MVLSYKGKYYSDEDIAKRVLLAKTDILDSDTRLFIMNLSKIELKLYFDSARNNLRYWRININIGSLQTDH